MNSELIYGLGCVSINTTEQIKRVEIKYFGTIEILHKLPRGYVISSKYNRIIIYRWGNRSDQYLTDELFKYIGLFKIQKATLRNDNEENIYCKIKPQNHLIRNIHSEYQYINENYEDMKYAYKYGNEVFRETIIKNNIVDNLNTSEFNENIYNENKQIYNGPFHYHVNNNQKMSGFKHTKESINLYTSEELKIK